MFSPECFYPLFFFLQICIHISISIFAIVFPIHFLHRPSSEQPMRALSGNHDRFKFQRTATHHPGSLQWGPTYANVQLANGKPQCKWIQNIQLKTPFWWIGVKEVPQSAIWEVPKLCIFTGGGPFVKNFTTMIKVPISWTQIFCLWHKIVNNEV